MKPFGLLALLAISTQSLASGSYKVTTKADTYWGSGLKQFAI